MSTRRRKPTTTENEAKPDVDLSTITAADFVAFLPLHNYIFLPTREAWGASGVNALLMPIALLKKNGEPVRDKKGEPKVIPASVWLDQNQAVHAMCWSPNDPPFIPDRVLADGGWVEKLGAVSLNLYRPPTIQAGDARKAKPWIDHLRKIYPADADHIMKWMAHRVQFPGEKCNHALMLGGAQGTGKDTLLEPLRLAVGPWNFAEVSPSQLTGRFNPFLKSVVLRVNEARDLGSDMDRFEFYDRTKTMAAAPPNTHHIDDKNLRMHYILNVNGLAITSNYLSDGIYLPADDRRHYVCWCELTRDDFDDGYWKRLYDFYENGGIENVASFLMKLDLTGFDAKAPPLKTPAFWRIVDSNRSPEEGELADVIEKLGKPDALTIAQLITQTKDDELAKWLTDRKNRRVVPHRLESVGYVPVRNPSADSNGGMWRVSKAKVTWAADGTGGKPRAVGIETERQAVYAKRELPLRDQIRAVERLLNDARARAQAAVDRDAAAAGTAKVVPLKRPPKAKNRTPSEGYRTGPAASDSDDPGQ